MTRSAWKARPGSSDGLGLLAFSTTLEQEKQLRNVRGRLLLEDAEVSGYEIHAGVTSGAALERAAVRLEDGSSDGALSADGQVLGTYLHGLFEIAGGVHGLAALGRIAGCAGGGLSRLARTRYRAPGRSGGAPLWIPIYCVPCG